MFEHPPASANASMRWLLWIIGPVWVRSNEAWVWCIIITSFLSMAAVDLWYLLQIAFHSTQNEAQCRTVLNCIVGGTFKLVFEKVNGSHPASYLVDLFVVPISILVHFWHSLFTWPPNPAIIIYQFNCWAISLINWTTWVECISATHTRILIRWRGYIISSGLSKRTALVARYL